MFLNWHNTYYLNMSGHVNNLCCTALLAIRNIGRIRSTEHLVHAFVSSKLDYRNSVCMVTCEAISKLQRLQNSAARLVTKAKRRDHITPVLRQLHWLPINQRIVFKILFITFKITNGYAPSYLSSLLESYKPKRAFRSATKRLLKVIHNHIWR